MLQYNQNVRYIFESLETYLRNMDNDNKVCYVLNET